MNERLIFEHALDIPDPDQRNAYLDQECGDDARLRQRVQALLASHAQDQSFLAGNAFTLDPTLDSTSQLEQVGDEIGPFKLLQQIGEGGMGVVYMAEQTTPVIRRVALKVIKPGMDTRQVIARFEAERQALAMMEHPNIARVLDCGTTDSGRPYFVMELVKGIPITRYCDQNHLSTRQRLELFIPICRAIQHAHQKGIIHRDIKPSNILVADYDDRAVPKIIDFGLAKALSTRLTDKTMFTQLGQIVGTLEYMSPEQAKVNQVDIDTRSDIYSLGVLLYELLTGETPFDRQRLRSAAFDEILKIIREEEPPRPSLRLSTSESLPTIASNRHVEPHKLTTLLRGELDWIVMKALEKDRGRRYDSASKFAEDVRHYLNDEEVSACPPSAWYRFRKFARRRRSALLTSATIAVVILLGVGLLGWNIRDRASRQEAAAREQSDRQTRLAAQVESVLFEANRLMEEKQWAAALSTAARAEAVVAGGDVHERTQEKVRELINDLQMVQRLEKARHLNAVWTATQFDHRGAAEELAAAFRQYGISLEKLPDQDSVARLKSRSRLAVRFAVALDDWAGYLNQMGRKSDAIKLIALADEVDSNSWRSQVRAALLNSGPKPERDGLLKKLATTAPVNDLAPSCFWQLASELRHRGYVEEGRDLLRKAQAAHPSDYWINFDLATFCNLDETPEAAMEAAAYFRVANALRPIDAAPLNGLAGTLTTMGRLDESIACYQRALKVDAEFTPAWVNLGRAYAAKNEFERALDNYERALNLAPQNALVHSNMGEALRNMGKLPEAIHAFETALKYDPRDRSTQINLGIALNQMGQFEQAIEHFLVAIDINSNDAIAYVNLGNAQQSCQLFDDAVSSYRKAIELHPKLQAAHYCLGIALMEAGRLDEAVVSWKEVLAIDPQSDRTECIQSYNNLGVSRAQRGDLDGAIHYWRTSLGIQPTDVRTRQYLVRAIVQQARQLAGDNAVEQARQACKEALELTADRPEASLRQWRGEAEQLMKTMSDPESGTDDAINSNSQSPDSVQK